MTLILTKLDNFGISMAADSAVTQIFEATGQAHAVPNAAKKLFSIPYLQAGISCWGMGTIDGIQTDEWLSAFINSNIAINTIADFADELADNLNRLVPRNQNGNPRLGFHLAAFEEYEDEPVPSFFHIHDGPSTTLQGRGITVDPYRFNPNHDIPPDVYRQLYSQGLGWITRNGDYFVYSQIFSLLGQLFRNLGQIGIVVPCSQNLDDCAEYLVFQIRTISEIYRLSNLVPGIGGCIYYLTISPDGINSEGTKYYW